MYRAPSFTREQILYINGLLQFRLMQDVAFWTDPRLSGESDPPTVFRGIVQAQEYYRPFFEALLLWEFQMQVDRLGGIQAVMNDDFHAKLLNLIEGVDWNEKPEGLHPLEQEGVENVRKALPGIVAALKNAPTLNPEATKQTNTQPPASKYMN